MNDFVFLALGSNIENKKENIEKAIVELKNNFINIIDISPLYTTPALMFKDSPSEWNIPYLNCIVKVKTDKTPQDLLLLCKNIEKKLGRDFSKRWAPRPIDIDILFYKNQEINTDILTIPHKEINNRSFVLDPLSFVYPEKAENYYKKTHQPVFMGIMNITPDSFSDGGKFNDFDNFIKSFELWQENNVAIIDIGAESTRPNATKLTPEEEINRLNNVFDYIKNREKKIFNSLLSIDTYHYKTAEKAIENGFNIINDVSGLEDDNMLELAKNNKDIKFVFMHNLGIPTNKNITVKGDIVVEVKKWLYKKINIFEKNNIKKEQLIFDIGIGFGKTQSQSLQLLQNIKVFHEYGFKILVGHSRKSFMNIFTTDKERDVETLSISMKIAKDVDVIRVHTPLEHQRALIAMDHCYNQFL